MTKILLHACCGPCATYPFEFLRGQDYEVTGFFYNPNIFPIDEYSKRKEAMGKFADQVGLSVIYQDNDVQIEPGPPAGEAGNCEECYKVRLRKCAKTAKEKGFDCFSTTLLISPYQKHELLKETGEKIALEENINFLYHDFRVGFQKSRELSRLMDLYRQKYCGCEKSKSQNPNDK